MNHVSDVELNTKISDLQLSIKKWLTENNLDHDCGFKTWIEHFNNEPGGIPCILVFWYENALHDQYELLEELCINVVGQLGYFAESWDRGTLCIYLDDESGLQAAFQNRIEWQWLLHLIENSYFDLNAEIFSYTAKNPHKLTEMSPRAFEKYLDAVFRNNGYRTLLGPGNADGGVDIRLYNNDVVGEVLTLVQAKRYAPHRPIGLQAVQALSANVDDEQANRGLFVTTSRYLPSTRSFAERKNNKIVLADSDQITLWAKKSAKMIERDKSQWISKKAIYQRLEEARLSGGAKGVYVSHSFSIGINHQYALLLRAIGKVALMLKIPAVNLSGDGIVGTNVPMLTEEAVQDTSRNTIFRVHQSKKQTEKTSYWGNHNLWTPYDGQPIHYDRLD